MIPNNDFLALTLNNPERLAPFTANYPNGVAYVEETGIIRLEPTKVSEISLVLSVGVHGNETGPIELVNQLLSAILDGHLSLNIRLLVIIGHPVAANKAERFCDVNLNRLFRGAWTNYQGLEVPRAQQLEKAVSDFFAAAPEGSERLHYDLHTAIRGSEHEKFAVYPFLDGAPYSKTQLAFLAASGIDAVLLSHQPTTTFSYHSSALHGAHSFTIELGKVYPFGKNDLSRFDAIKQTLIQLIEEGRFAEGDIASIKLFAVQDALIKDAEDYKLAIADDVKNFTEFKQGFELATSSKSTYRVKATGDAIIFPNANVPVGQRTGLMVRAVSLNELPLS